MKYFGIIMAAFSVLLLSAEEKGEDAKASAKYEEGYAFYRDGKYKDAAECFKEAEFLARNPTIRANSLLALSGAWRMCAYYYREYQCIENLLDKYPDFTNYEEMIEREYDIARLFFGGHRDPMYWALRWIPWLTGEDHSGEIYKKLLQRAPFHKRAPEALLALAMLYNDEGKTKESLAELRKLLQNHPDSPQAKIAALALGNGLCELAKRGDGDGAFNREASEVLKKFVKEHPGAPENDWVKRKLLQNADLQSERLYALSEYYRKAGREETARRYLSQLLLEYPESAKAETAERALTKVDPSFVPGDFPAPAEERLPQLKAYPIPQEAEGVLYTPGVGDHHFLTVIPDLRRSLPENNK